MFKVREVGVHHDDCHSRLEIANKLLDVAELSKNVCSERCSERVLNCTFELCPRFSTTTLTPVRDCWKVLGTFWFRGTLAAWLLVLTTPTAALRGDGVCTKNTLH